MCMVCVCAGLFIGVNFLVVGMIIHLDDKKKFCLSNKF